MKYLMTTILLSLFACLCWQCSAADTSEAKSTATMAAENGNFTINVAGLGAGTVRLVGMLNDQQFLVDEATSDANGSVTFTKDEPYRQGIYFVLLSNNANFQMIIAEDQTFTLSTQVNDLVGGDADRR